MKIAIHHRSDSFSEYWIKYCQTNSIEYKIVNSFNNDIMKQVEDCDVFMWHYSHALFHDINIAKKILFSLEQANIKVYPNINTCWHFDDKVAQKYLLEAIKAPLVPSYVFYNSKEARNWVNSTTFPKIFKLKGGAGGTNVKLITTRRQALNVIRTAFTIGFSQFNSIGNLKDSISSYKHGRAPFSSVIKATGRIFIPPKFSILQPRERAYVYFQDFIPENDFDIRVVVIGGERAVAERRLVRENDFRASGSSLFRYDNINVDVIQEAFRVANLLKLQTVAFDFIYDKNGKPLIIELSYGFGMQGISEAPGYWDINLKFYPAKVELQNWLMNYIIKGTTD